MQNRAGLKYVLGYCAREKNAVGIIGCWLAASIEHRSRPLTEMVNTKLLYKKDATATNYHMVQAFDPKDTLTPETAHEIALRLPRGTRIMRFSSVHIWTDRISIRTSSSTGRLRNRPEAPPVRQRYR
jgi:hypothetical protein